LVFDYLGEPSNLKFKIKNYLIMAFYYI